MENSDDLTSNQWQQDTGAPTDQDAAEMSFLAMDDSSAITTDLHFLNSEESDPGEPFMQTLPDASDGMLLESAQFGPESSMQNTTLNLHAIRSLFEVESLNELSALGVDVQQLEAEGKLKQLSFLVPVKVFLQPIRLVQQIATLLVPHISENGAIWLQLTPYLPQVPAETTFSEQQRDAIEAAEPFYCIKRVTLGQGSDEFMDKQDALWRALSHSLSVSRSLFEEIMLTLIHRPHHLPEIAIEQRWYEYQRKDYWKALNAHFPCQIGIFNGLTIHFYPLASLQALPHLAEMVRRLIPQEVEN